MPVRPELHVRLPNSPGSLAALCRLLADERVDIVAFGLERQGTFRVVVDNHVRAAAVLRARHYQVREGEAIVVNVSGGPEGLVPALSLLSDAGINVEYAYGSSGRGGQPAVVIGVADPLRASAASGL